MDILGIDIAKAKFDVHLCTAQQQRRANFPNAEAGFVQLKAWLDKHRPEQAAPLHACMEATGNWGLDLAAFLCGQKITVSIVNPRQIKAFGDSELARNKTDRLDAALIARFCRAHTPPPWTPPAPAMRDLREMVRRCEALKAARVQELNRRKSGFANALVAASIDHHIAYLDQQIQQITDAVRQLIASDPSQQAIRELLLSIIGVGEVTASVIMAELPNLVEFTPKGLAAFAGLSPQERSSGSSLAGSRSISRVGSPRLRSALYLAALSAKRHNPRLADFIQRMREAGKPPKVILIAVARRLLVYAHAVVRSGKPFSISHQAVDQSA